MRQITIKVTTKPRHQTDAHHLSHTISSIGEIVHDNADSSFIEGHPGTWTFTIKTNQSDEVIRSVLDTEMLIDEHCRYD